MKWVTRAHIHIDRAACPWLIKRFIDTEAEFFFVAKEHVLETAKTEKATPFDIPGIELSHDDDSCTFVSFLNKYNLSEPALWKLGDLINIAQRGDFKSHPFASCLDAISQGYSLLFPDDLENIEQQFGLYDALYNFFRMNSTKDAKNISMKKKTDTNLLFSFPHETIK
jgi:hypothetical protein